jgi:hypothetical protein
VPGLAADQDPSHRTGITDAQAWRTTFDFGGRRVRQVWQMAFTGVNDQHADIARGLEHGGDRFHGSRKLRHVVTKRLAKAAGLHEIALHVDNDERGYRPVELDWLRLRGDNAHR